MKKLFQAAASAFLAISCLCITPEAGAANHAVTVADGNGNAISVWQNATPYNTFIQAAVFSYDSGCWSSYTQLSDPSINSYEPRIAIDKGTGNAVVIWQGDNADYGINSIYAAMLIPSSPYESSWWTSPAQISSNSESTVQQHTVTISPTTPNQIVATWSAYDTFGNERINSATASFGVTNYWESAGPISGP